MCCITSYCNIYQLPGIIGLSNNVNWTHINITLMNSHAKCNKYTWFLLVIHVFILNL